MFPHVEDIEKHITDMQDLFEKLLVADQILDANLLVAMVLRIMPDSFNPLTTAPTKTKLIDEAAKRSCSRGEQSALKACTRKPINCHHCQKVGYKQKDCRLLAQIREAESKQRGRNTKAKVVRSPD